MSIYDHFDSEFHVYKTATKQVSTAYQMYFYLSQLHNHSPKEVLNTLPLTMTKATL